MKPDSRPTADGQAPVAAIAEIRRLSGLTWDQLAEIFGIARRNLHFWASGERLSPAHELRLLQLLATIRRLDRGSSSENRTLLLTHINDHVLPLELLKQGNDEQLLALLGEGPGLRRIVPVPLSAEAAKARRPLPPATLVDARQDRMDVETGRLLASKPVRRHPAS